MGTNSLQQLADRTASRFEQQFHRRPNWIVAAPGRVNIIGEHVDYNDGFVLPMAIERYCVIAGGAVTGSSATVFSAAADDEAQISADTPRRNPTAGHWSNYVA